MSETLRFDRVARSAGLIRSMKTYTVIFKQNTLYLICVGPAMRFTSSFNPLTHALISGMSNSYDKKIAVGEQRLNTESLEMLSQTPHSFGLSSTDIENISIKKDVFGFPAVTIKTSQTKIHLQFRKHSYEQVASLITAIQQVLPLSPTI